MNNLEIREIFNTVSDWLKFAEAKNAAIMAIGGIFLSAILSIPLEAHILFKAYAWSATIFLGVSAFIAICSFVPQLKIPIFFRQSIDENPSTQVLVYFADIAAMELEDFKSAIMRDLGTKELSALELHYVQQIHTNSCIALRKFAFFNVAVWFLVASIFTPLGCLALLIMKKNKEI